MAREWTKKEVDELHKKLILAVYYEFCYKQRNEAFWQAGFEMYNKLGSL